MNKKILTSLLMTPLAFGAMADITNVVPIPLDSKDWTQTGISDTDVFLATGGVNCPIEGGQLEYKQAITLLPGTYKLVFEQAQNVAVQINGIEYALSNGAATFTLEEKSDVKVAIVSLNKQAGFKFYSIRLDLVFDFKAAAEHFEAQLPLVHALNNSKSELLDEYKALNDEIAAIQSRIKKVADEASQKDAYEQELLWNYPASDEITLAINKLKESGKVEALNEKIAWDNTVYALNEKVSEYKAAFDEAIKGIDEKQAYRDDVVKYAEASRDAEAEEMQNLINAFTKEVADGTITETEFNKKREELQLTLQGYFDEINGFINDAKAYYDMQASYNTLRDTFTKSLSALFALQGVKGEFEDKTSYDYADAFNALNAEWQKALTDHLTKGTTPVEEIMGAATKGEDGKYAFDGQKIEGAVAAFEEGKTQEAVDAAIAAMEALVKDNTDKVGTQGELMTAAVNAIHAQQVLLPMNMILPGNLAKETIELNNRLNALLKEVEAAYAQLSLSEETYKTELDDITKAIEKMGPVMELFGKYNALVEYINKNVNVEGSVINGKFKGSLDAIWESISTYDNAATSSPAQIEKAIVDTQANAKKLVEAQADAQKVLDEYKNIMDELDAEIAKVKLLEGVDAGKVKKDSGYDAFVSGADDYNQKFLAVAELGAQECYDALVQLAKELNAEKNGFQTKTIELKQAYVEAAMTANKAFVEAKYNATVKEAGTSKCFKKALDAIKTDLGNVLVTVAATSTDPVGEANKAYDTLTKILAELEKLNGEITQYWVDYKWANEQKTNLTDQADAIAKALEKNEETSWDPAKGYFTETLNGYEKDRADHLAKVDNALANLEATGKFDAATATEKFNKEAVEKAVDKLVKDVKAASDKIIPNHDAYVGLLGTAETTQRAIQDAQELLTNSLKDSGISPEDTKVKEWQDDIDNLTDQLTEFNQQLSNYYGTGEADANKDALTAKYNKLKDAAKELMNGEKGINHTFGNVVADANGAYLDMWTAKYNHLLDVYTQTLNAFNAYGSKHITNGDYYDYLLENVVIGDAHVLDDHKPIYDYSSRITELNNEVTKFINGHNDKVITETEYAEKATNRADVYIREMQGLVTDMQGKATQFAQVYFETIIDEAQTEVSGVKTALEDAGCSEGLIKRYTDEAQLTIDNQNIAYETALGNAGSDVVLTVNTIAEKLADISIDEKAAAQDAWKEIFEADTKDLTEKADAIAGFKYIAADDKNLTEFNEAKAAVDAMASLVTTDLATLKENLAALATQYNAAVAAFDALKAKNDAAELADTTTEELKGELDRLREENDALNEYAEGLAGTPDDYEIAGNIKSIQDDVDSSKDIVKDAEDIKRRIAGVDENIANSYTSLVKNEYYKLDELMAKVFDAYQAVLEAEKFDKETAEAEKTLLNNLQSGVEATDEKPKQYGVDNLYLDYKSGLENEERRKAYKEEATKLEETLSDKLNELQSMLPDVSTDMANAITALNEKYSAACEAVDAGKAALDKLELVKDEYTTKYDNLKKELEDIATAFDAKGNAVILYQDAFASQIDAVVTELEALNAEAVAAQAAEEKKAAIAGVTKDNVNALNAELEAALTALKAAEERAHGWEVKDYDTDFAGFRNTLDVVIREDIEADSTISKENPDGLTEDEKDEYSESIAQVRNAIAGTVENAAMVYAENANQATTDSISVAREALTVATVVNSTALGDSIAAQATALERARNNTHKALEAAEDTDARVAEYESFVVRSKEIRDKIAEIMATITENTYILGDVDGNGGEPNATDVMTLLGWIGQKLTIEGIAETDGKGIAAAADVNGDNQLNIADAAALFKLIMTAPGERPARIIAARSAEGDAIYALTRTGEEAGSRIYSLSLNNSGDFVGAQVDIKLPAGMNLVDAQMTERASGHEVQIYDNGNGNYRLLVFSAENAVFEGNAGELVNLTIEGIGTPVVEEMILSTPAHAAVLGHAADTNMLDSIIEGAHNMKERIYNAAGQSLRAVQRGINIIRHSDGSTTKELHK